MTADDGISGLVGDLGLCTITVGGVRGGDHGPIDTGRWRGAAPGSKLRYLGFSGLLDICRRWDSVDAVHCEGCLGLSREERPRSGSFCIVRAGLWNARRGDGIGLIRFSKCERSDDTGLIDVASVLVSSGRAMATGP
jgi:hypothetical protein